MFRLIFKRHHSFSNTNRNYSSVPEIFPFSSNTHISQPLQKSLSTVFKYENMTDNQHKVLSRIPLNTDILVKSKTGSGKTLSFLIAAVETALMKKADISPEQRGVSVVIICPTRELAVQINDEAERLLRYTKFKSLLMVGGDKRTNQIKRIQNHECDIVVACPGRILDLIKSNDLFFKKCKNVNPINFCDKVDVLVLDEVDRLLEIGFQVTIDSINSFLPKKKRSILFSATVTNATEQLARKIVDSSYSLIDCVPKNEDFIVQIRQSCHVVSMSQQMSLLFDLIQSEKAKNPKFKIIVFFPTKTLAAYMTQIYSNLNLDIIELHAQLTPRERLLANKRFRSAETAIMFTTDVSARGVDYPDLSLVIQMGVPTSREQYIHRIGRTGRAGKDGKAILILSPLEKKFLDELKNFPILVSPVNDYRTKTPNLMEAIKSSIRRIDVSERVKIFTSWFSYYSTIRKSLSISTQSYVGCGKDFSTYFLGLEHVPKLNGDSAKRFGVGQYPEFQNTRRVPSPKMNQFEMKR